MTNSIPIHIAYEDALSGALIETILAQSGRDYHVGSHFTRGGSGYLKGAIEGFNAGARSVPFLVLTDLDEHVCAPSLKRVWLTQPQHPNLLFRIAVRETEAWIMADREAFARFVGVRIKLVPPDVEDLQNAKQKLLAIASQSSKRAIRADLVPRSEGPRLTGPNYNVRLAEFVRNHWRSTVAAKNSPSLARTLTRVEQFSPVWPPKKAA